MPFRNKDTLEAWLREFAAMGYSMPDHLRVVQQDGDEGANTGLVMLTLDDPPTVIAVQPREPYAVDWVVSILPREKEVALSGPTAMEYSGVLASLSLLCAFLETKSRGYLQRDAP